MERSRIIEINRAGLDNRERYLGFYTPVLTLVFDLGQEGIDLSLQPDVTGYRYGSVPECGISHNYRDDIMERGCSLAHLEGQKEVGSSFWFSDREKVKVEGLLLPFTGSDDEPLVIPYCIEDYDKCQRR